MAVDKNKNKQILVTIPNETLDEIEAYWHKNELKNRSEAIRELIQLGLKKESSD